MVFFYSLFTYILITFVNTSLDCTCQTGGECAVVGCVLCAMVDGPVNIVY
jgi:hypothetical protein